ncbi:mannose-6-phosphate isomerase [Paludibacter sp. 221]|uniref:type I phosphomannose isomerase catalytic subunit n=1 Tax=Paludibacter sp. 221 TaxID=2302939 RepID=UPI0013D89144|nr:type I phosphomannose isomerase catalytic subunit [Paludibacter sp. 221]NDV47171.1 mannose-6-phosphate isomerase [Paludibacter sp. 221]
MLYPLKFEPILKDKIWGGTKLQKLFNKPAKSERIGESWELSGYKEDKSVVTNGFLAGNDIEELIEVYMGELVGDEVFDKFGLSFPLLFKLIDANDDLSIQVHPNDEVGAERHDACGKTEMWYVLDAEPGAELIIGFSKDTSREEYIEAVEKGKVENLLQKVSVKKGDVFFIPAGLVHSIGKGVVVAEIQQTSDLTYRIYDYKRTDEHGKERELHIEQALDVINFNAIKEPKTQYKDELNKVVKLVESDYFITNIIRFNQEIIRSYASLDSFVVYICAEGSFCIEYDGETTAVAKGETALIPAIIDQVKLIPAKESTILEVYVP